MSENQLTDLLLYYAYAEQELEVVRETLCKSRGFIPYNLFKYIDCIIDNPKGYIDADDLQYFVKTIRGQITLATSLFIQNYNQNQDGKMVYSEFLRAVLPISNQELREFIALTSPTSEFKLDSEVLHFFCKLIEAEVKLTEQAEKFKKCITDEFQHITRDYAIFPNDMLEYFRSQGISTTQSEIQLIFNRIDLLNDGKIDRREWNLHINPRNHKLQRKSTSYKKRVTNERYESEHKHKEPTKTNHLMAAAKLGFYSSQKPKQPYTVQHSTPSKYSQQKTELRAQMKMELLQKSDKKRVKPQYRSVGRPVQKPDRLNILQAEQGRKDPVMFYLNLFDELIRVYVLIERQKQMLCKHAGFSLINCFQTLDKQKKGYLNSSDLRGYLKCPELILSKYGKDNKIGFSNFIRLIEPLDFKSVYLLQSKEYSNPTNQISQTSIISIRMLFEQIEYSESLFQEARQYLKGQTFNLKDIFGMMSYDKTNLSNQDFQDFFAANRIVVEADGINLLLNHLDVDQDGYISYSDFTQMLC